MERREFGDPMREATNKLYDFAERIQGDVVVKGGEFHIEKGGIRAEVHVDSIGKVSYELFDGDDKILGQENTDLETVFENVQGRIHPEELEGRDDVRLNPSPAREPLSSKERIVGISGTSKTQMESSAASNAEEAA